jgi:hypothetical protein
MVSQTVEAELRCWREAAGSDLIKKSVLNYIELQTIILHREQKSVIFAMIKAPEERES